LLWTVLFFAIFVSCKKQNNKNYAKLNIHYTDNFIISSIQNGPNNQILCVGKYKNSDSFIVLRYDRDLNLLETIWVSNYKGLKGNLKLTYLMNKGWLISVEVKTEDSTSLNAIITNEEFSIIHKKQLMKFENFGFYKGTVAVNVQKELKNGDFVLACDSMNWYIEKMGGYSRHFGVSVFRLTSNLNFRHSPFYGKKDTSYTYEYESFKLNITELNDGSIFYFYLTNLTAISGILEQNGNVRYQTSRKQTYSQINPVGISFLGENILLNSAVKNTQLQYYTILDPNSGNVIKESSLPLHTINTGEFGPNPLPELFDSEAGHVLFSEDLNKLFFLKVDREANLSKVFDISLSKFSDIYSYRQLPTSQGTIIIGTSYAFKGINYFTLQEVKLDGNPVK